MDYSLLPSINAGLNSVCTVLLLTGYVLIRRKRTGAHQRCMIAAFLTSVLFLVSYLVYHAKVGSVAFEGEGSIRSVYFAILISHSILAAIVPILAILTLVHAFRGKLDKHRRLARWTLPIWLYVSVTGVVVYWMLYRMDFSA
jgi:uncharacterized membrane protein YozB (DUF420 family)